MRKFTNKKGARVLSLVLAVIMAATVFGVALPEFKLNASAAGSITTQDGLETITQTQIVTSDRQNTYDNYATKFLDGASRPTDIVIPGLPEAQDYTIQGMTYYAPRDWMLVTAYHNYNSKKDAKQFSSKVFAIDAATGEFVAMFSFLNPGGSENVDHGGGIAVSEHNIYYACGDADRKIAYAPISYLETAPEGQHTVIPLAGEHIFTEVGSINDGDETAYTAYVCYDEGVLWTGNFYDPGVKILGVSVAATDYSVPANDAYKSMVFGYELKGDSSTDEWNNLIGASSSTDCQGNPSYAIGLNNAIKDVQYATVDNGKLYLSCSFGTGEGTASVTLGGMRPYSQFIVADIDLSVAGTKTISIATNTSGGTRSVLAHDIQDYALYDMMPMSEGLCVIEGKIYITFESASNKYLKEAGALTGNCKHPIDVIWELDPHALMEIEKAEPENSIYYEKVNSNADIVNGEEYMIVYESDAVDPVTQQKILYAFDADGNFKGHKLSKSTADNMKGYDGMVGHPITQYAILKAGKQDSLGNTYDRDILFLDNKEKDDVESVRWTLTNNGGTNYSIKNTDTYFANCNSFYVDANRITMLPSTAGVLSTMDIGQFVAGNGYFYISNNGAYLWCNDGLDANYNSKANAYYAANAGTTPIFSGLTETPGTIHCNAKGSTMLGGSIPAAEEGKAQAYPDSAFQIYRRVTDSAASTYESRVFTDLNAELQADGTYTIDLETYAISPNHYKHVGERPTDYIIVTDASSSTTTKDSTGIISYGSSNELSVETLSGSEDDTSNAGEVCVKGYAFSDPAQDIYFLHSDGEYYKIYLAVATVEFKDYVVYKKIKQRYWAYYVTNDGMYHVLQTSGSCSGVDGGVFDPITRETFINHVDNSASLGDDSQYSAYSTDSGNKSGRRSTVVYKGAHYRFTTNSEFTRLDTIKKTATDLIDDIKAQNPNNRIALVKYGNGTSYYATSGWASSGYTNAFWNAADDTGVATLKTEVNNLTTTEQTDNNGIEFVAANAIIENSDAKYDSDGSRNVVIIFMSDGIPGADNNSATASAANAVLSKAYAAKKKGAFVYSVMTGQASVSGFNKKTYMEAVSTKYAAAQSMTNLGGQSIDGVNYLINLSDCTIDTYLNFGEVTTKEVKQNTEVGLLNLDAGAILRQELSDAFIVPAGTQPQVSFVEGKFDAIGRFSFSKTPAAATGVTCNWSADDQLLTVTGYDYSTQYISKGKTGNKLRIRITGVLANENATIQNTPVSNTSTTALYQTSEDMTATGGDAFKYLPTVYFNIPKYTYVLDYGIQMLDTDVNGTLCAVSEHLSQQNVNNYVKESQNGLVAIQSGDQNLLYSTTGVNATDSGYVLIKRDDGTYDWFEIQVAPASNVLFEDTQFGVSDAGALAKASWATQGSPLASSQDLSANEEVYGYDSNYANGGTGYSNGTAQKVTVNTSTKRSTTSTFTYVGKGFDLMSVCGSTTGILVVTVRDSSNKIVKSYIVDTYYNDTVNNPGVTLNQVPVVNHKNNYGTYTVEVTAAYLSNASALQKSASKAILAGAGVENISGAPVGEQSAKALLQSIGMEDVANSDIEVLWQDDNSIFNGGTGSKGNVKRTARAGGSVTSLDCYLDGIRVYNPVEDEVANNVYINSEKGATYYNVIENLSNGNFDGSETTNLGSIAYVTNASDETLSFANYQKVGPQNELYLAKGNASNGVTFKVGNITSDSRIMVSLRAIGSATTAKIGANTISVNSSTELYYDITDSVSIDKNTGTATVSIFNTGNGILSVNNIKLTGGAAAINLEASDLSDAQLSYYTTAKPTVVENGVVKTVEDNIDTDIDTDVDTDVNTGEGDTGSDSSTEEVLSPIEEFIRMIMDIISGIFKFLPTGEVA